MKKETKDKHFIQKPIYLGGQKAMNKFIKDNLVYPELAAQKGIEGDVLVRYGINHKGVVVECKIVSGLGGGCDEEAERVVRLLKFNVAKQYKARVLFHKTIRIWFKKPKVQKKAKMQLNYVATEKKKPVNQNRKEETYSYTINIPWNQ